jgi:outer membrane biosynthesis protein TonB
VPPASRPLAFDPADGRPDTAFGLHWLSGLAIVGGVLTSVLIPLVFAGLVVVCALIAVALGAAAEEVLTTSEAEPPRESILEDDVIEARFVRLGRDFQNELPDRVVPVLSTAPPEPSEVPRENTPAQTQPTARIENRPPNTVNDLLTRLDRRAELFEEMADRRDEEGSPEGIEEGTERQGTEGDLYRGRLYSFFRRGWTIPTTLSRDEARRLTVVVNVQIGGDLQIRSFEIRTSSGNPLFDDSAMQQLTRLQASSTPIPPPPEDVADQYVGRTIAVRFSGREAGR